MTAVAVQRGPQRQQYNPQQSPHSSTQVSPHTSRPQSYNVRNTPPTPVAPHDLSNSATLNGGPQNMSTTTTVISGQYRTVNGDGGPSTDRNGTSARSVTNGASIENVRPTSASGPNALNSTNLNRINSLRDDSEAEQAPRRQKPLLLRSRSDFGPRGDEAEHRHDEEGQDWGARHGFEDHYASEEYVSQLANVSHCWSLGFHSRTPEEYSLLQQKLPR
jgi:regulator-associated protein of mTOR